MNLNRSVPGARRLVAAIAVLAALGLAVAHLTVNLAGPPGSAAAGLRLAWVLLPSALAVAIALAAVQAGRQARPGRLVRSTIVGGAIVLWLLVVVSVVLTVATRTMIILRLDGPGLWAIVGAPAFTALSVMISSRIAGEAGIG